MSWSSSRLASVIKPQQAQTSAVWFLTLKLLQTCDGLSPDFRDYDGSEKEASEGGSPPAAGGCAFNTGCSVISLAGKIALGVDGY